MQQLRGPSQNPIGTHSGHLCHCGLDGEREVQSRCESGRAMICTATVETASMALPWLPLATKAACTSGDAAAAAAVACLSVLTAGDAVDESICIAGGFPIGRAGSAKSAKLLS